MSRDVCGEVGWQLISGEHRTIVWPKASPLPEGSLCVFAPARASEPLGTGSSSTAPTLAPTWWVCSGGGLKGAVAPRAIPGGKHQAVPEEDEMRWGPDTSARGQDGSFLPPSRHPVDRLRSRHCWRCEGAAVSQRPCGGRGVGSGELEIVHGCPRANTVKPDTHHRPLYLGLLCLRTATS